MTRTIVLEVLYPVAKGSIVLRTDLDWERDLLPVHRDGDLHRFEFEATAPFHYYKPLLRDDGGVRWARGENYLIARGESGRVVYPHFDDAQPCGECVLKHLPSSLAAAGVRIRVFEPRGYRENPLVRYPVLYMQDGQNLFFDHEAFQGRSWRVQDAIESLTGMSLIEPAIVVGVYPDDRMRQYVNPGYGDYGRVLTEELVPFIDSNYRTKTGPLNTSVIGSSLGGVVSFYLAWQFPEVFGAAACLSSTFGHENDLMERVARETKRDARFYLDSGWPHDNYEVTLAMRNELMKRGYVAGLDLLHFAFPGARHDEQAWSSRLHLPLQFLLSRRPADSSLPKVA